MLKRSATGSSDYTVESLESQYHQPHVSPVALHEIATPPYHRLTPSNGMHNGNVTLSNNDAIALAALLPDISSTAALGTSGATIPSGMSITKSTTSDGWSTSFLGRRIRHLKTGVEKWWDKFAVVVALTAWYVVGVLAIVTTKIQLQDWRCPPLVLTVQQMILASLILRFVVTTRDGALQPMPWDTATTTTTLSCNLCLQQQQQSTTTNTASSSNSPISSSETNYEYPTQPNGWLDRIKRQFPWLRHPNFILSGVFNALDFVGSNYAFSFSSAHFVETIKASEPITTTAIALLWKVDRLSTPEGGSLALLVAGVLLSTWGNSTDQQTSATDERKLVESIETAALTLSANIFFAFRAINQKRYRSLTHESQQMDDINFLCRMVQVGATFLIGPVVVLHYDVVSRVIYASRASQATYLGLALVNAVSYVTYK